MLKLDDSGLLLKNELGNHEINNTKKFLQKIKEKFYLPQITSNCPVCDSSEFSKFEQKRNLRSSETIFIEFEYLRQDLYICKSCGLVQVINILPPDFCYEYINTYYNMPDAPKNLEQINHVEENHNSWYKFFSEYVERDKGGGKQKILEVSSHYGTTLNALSKRHDCYGVEAEYKAATFSVSHYPILRKRIINDVVENCKDSLISLGRFDTVIFSCCFRQISNPIAVLDILSKIMKPGGYVIITEVVLSNYIFLESPQNVNKHFSHNKSFYYNINNLSYLLSKYGFVYVSSIFNSKGAHKDYDMSAAVFCFNAEQSNTAEDSNDLIKSSKILTDEIINYFAKFS
jgi:SAM-dependent methyltransferase